MPTRQGIRPIAAGSLYLTWSLGLAALLLSVGCFTPKAGPPPTPQPASLTSAEALSLYGRFCANCHGRKLSGGMASSLIDGYWEYGDSDAALYANIARGLENAGMPAFDQGLTPAQIHALVDLMRAAAKPLPQ
ncbi:MAG: hypothetical protein GKR89_22760 [Candidatus Latescibacteria bacterium]|nr:hypothetical protein [Candidatus Latescibacterota bacterium]